MEEIDVKKELTKLAEEINGKMDEYKKGIVSKEDIDNSVSEKLIELEGKFQVDGKPVMEYVKSLQDHVDKLDAKSKEQKISTDVRGEPFGKVLFDALKDSEEFKEYAKGKGSQFVMKLEKALSEGSNLVDDTTNDIQLIPPERVREIMFDPTRTVHMRDLIPVAPMEGAAVTWPKETAYSDGSGVTAENTAAGETTFTITAQGDLPEEIDAFVEMSKIMLEDFPALVGYLNTRLPGKLLEEEDDEILNGTGNVEGLLTVATAFAAGGQTISSPQRYDVITMAAKQLRVSEYKATAILMHPTDVALMKLAKDSNGQYIFPFIFIQNGRIVVNEVPVIENTSMTSGTYLIGDYVRGCQLWQRRGIEVKFYDSAAAGDVNKNMTTVVIRERIALSCFRTSAFVYDTFAASITELTA